MTRYEVIRDKLTEIFFMCPECKGDGGETDVILDDGSGPYYPCEVCNRKGYMNPFKKLYWKILCFLWDCEWYQKWQESKHELSGDK
jgi:hypothetical protein